MADIDRAGDKISTFCFMKMLQRLALLALCLAAGAARAEETTATVKANRVNVRGQATLNSEVVTQLREGESITVLEEITLQKPAPGEPAKWAKIALPANTPVWLYASFVENGEITANRLNVRSGPGENFSVLGRVEKGTKVQVIRTLDDWMEIVAPAGTYAFVSSDLLDMKPAAPVEIAKTTEPKKEEAKPKPVAPSEPAKKMEPAEPLPTVQVESPAQPVTKPVAVAETSPAKVMNDPTPVAPPTPDIVAPPAPAVVEAPKPAPAPAAPKLDPVSIPVTMPATGEVAIVEQAPPPVRIVTREGIVRRSVSVQAPSAFRLAAPESLTTTLDYLYPGDTGLELKWFLGRKIRVSGTEAIDPRWPNMPLIEIKTLEPIDE